MSYRKQIEYRILTAYNNEQLQKQVMNLLQSSNSTEWWETHGGITFCPDYCDPFRQVIVKFTMQYDPQLQKNKS